MRHRWQKNKPTRVLILLYAIKNEKINVLPIVLLEVFFFLFQLNLFPYESPLLPCLPISFKVFKLLVSFLFSMKSPINLYPVPMHRLYYSCYILFYEYMLCLETGGFCNIWAGICMSLVDVFYVIMWHLYPRSVGSISVSELLVQMKCGLADFPLYIHDYFTSAQLPPDPPYKVSTLLKPRVSAMEEDIFVCAVREDILINDKLNCAAH